MTGGGHGPTPGGAPDPGVLALAFDQAPVAFALFDADLRYIAVNGALAAMNGRAVAEHLGRRPTELFPALEAVEHVLTGVRDEGTPVVDHLVRDEAPGAGHGAFRATAFRIRAPDGGVAAIGGIVLDVSEEVRAQDRAAAVEEARREQSAITAQILDQVPIGITVQRGPELRYEYMNHAARATVPGQVDLTGRTIAEVFPEIEDTGATMWGRALAGETVVEHELPVAWEDPAGGFEGVRYYDVTFSPLRPSAGAAPDGVLTISREVTDEVRRRTELQRELEREHALAVSLQRALLPRRLPEIPGVELAAAYQPAGEGSEVGGDFYDVVPSGDGWLLVLGDVSGKGATAAGATAELRGALRGGVLRGLGLEELATLADELLASDADRDEFCTLALVALAAAPGAARVRTLLAGHPAPVLLRADGEHALVGRYGSAVGAGVPLEFTTTTTDLGPGDTLLLYTDGLLEAHGPGPGPEELPALLADLAPLEPTMLLAAARSKLVGDPASARDDVALLAVRVRAPGS